MHSTAYLRTSKTGITMTIRLSYSDRPQRLRSALTASGPIEVYPISRLARALKRVAALHEMAPRKPKYLLKTLSLSTTPELLTFLTFLPFPSSFYRQQTWTCNHPPRITSQIFMGSLPPTASAGISMISTKSASPPALLQDSHHIPTFSVGQIERYL